MFDKLGVASGARMARIFMDLKNQQNLTFSANKWIFLPSWHLRLYQAYSTSLVVDLMDHLAHTGPKIVEKWLQKPYYTFEILYSLYLCKVRTRFDTMCVHSIGIKKEADYFMTWYWLLPICSKNLLEMGERLKETIFATDVWISEIDK